LCSSVQEVWRMTILPQSGQEMWGMKGSRLRTEERAELEQDMAAMEEWGIFAFDFARRKTLSNNLGLFLRRW